MFPAHDNDSWSFIDKMYYCVFSLLEILQGTAFRRFTVSCFSVEGLCLDMSDAILLMKSSRSQPCLGGCLSLFLTHSGYFSEEPVAGKPLTHASAEGIGIFYMFALITAFWV